MRLVIYFAAIGVAVYLLIALIQTRGRRSPGSPRRGPDPNPGRRPGRPVAPDDDPAFLAELDRKRRAAERKSAGGARKSAGSGSQGSEQPETPRAAEGPDAGVPGGEHRADQRPAPEPGAAPQHPTAPDAEPDPRPDDGSGREQQDPR